MEIKGQLPELSPYPPSRFSQDAHDFAARIDKRIVLIDGPTLAELMIDHNIGVTEVARYAIKKVDSDYFGE